MKKLKNLNDIENEITQNDALLLYITSPNCNVCEVLKPKIEELFSKEFPKIKLIESDISETPELGGKFNIFSAPTILIFFDKKEFLREGRNVSLSLLKEKIQKIYKLYFG
ncbi:thioredoxin family protein [Nitrosophilus kaiyonis]|uniref:thioredoxin family protein n=1 Tax=Nitrosophilus kaiyonis TaxID=2930200 RepID=UPI0024935E9F|nr:thioredoxin family protein [Nitrosophilus kaiyonis]